MSTASRKQALHDKAEEQRNLCRDWLIFLMTKSHDKPATKETLRAEAMKRWRVSKSAFDFGWIEAIEQTGNHRWYEPLPRGKKRPGG